MRNAWLVARAEYRRLVRQRSFLLATAGMPLLIVLASVVGIIAARSGESRAPIGYVDQAGVIRADLRAEATARPDDVEMRRYPDAAAAGDALTRGEIQVFFTVPADYLQRHHVEVAYLRSRPSVAAGAQFDRLLRASLVADLPAEAQDMALRGINLRFRSTETGREAGEGVFLNIILPFVIGLFFVIAVMSSGGYLLQAVSTEKENRTVEVMFTSISPLAFIGGKAAGLIAVAMTQIGVWAVTAVAAFMVASRFIPVLREGAVPWLLVAVSLILFVPTYALVAGLMIIIGSVVTEQQHGQQISGIINLLFFVPFFFLVLAFSEPDSPLLVAFTLFPTTSLITVSMRWGVTAIPAWQLVVGFLLLVLTALASIWLAARVFRTGMLSYGQPLDLRKLFAGRRTASPGADARR